MKPSGSTTKQQKECETQLKMVPLHQDCKEARKLLKSYLEALASFDSIKIATMTRVSAREVGLARDRLNGFRARYWQHVQKHRCRKR